VLVRAQVPVFSAALLSMGYTFSQTTAGEYVILHAISNRFSEPQSYTVNPEARTLNAVGSHDPRMAFDGRADTRWGTGAPQAPNQQYIIELKEPLALDGIGYVFSTWWADRPRELKIEVEDVSGKRTVVLSPFEAKGAFELSIREGSFVVRFEPLNAKRIILSQLARDQVFDWSIAEIELFSPEAQRS